MAGPVVSTLLLVIAVPAMAAACASARPRDANIGRAERACVTAAERRFGDAFRIESARPAGGPVIEVVMRPGRPQASAIRCRYNTVERTAVLQP